MTPSEQCKAAGMNSLQEVADMVGRNNVTLIRWAKSSPELFEAILLGCWAKKKKTLQLE